MRKDDLLLRISLVIYSIFSFMGISGINIAATLGMFGFIFLFFKKNKIYLYTDKENKRIIFILFLFLSWSILTSLFFSPEKKISFSRFIVQILEISLLFYVINIEDFDFKRKLIFIIIISAFLQSVYGIVQYFTGIDLVHKNSSIVAYERIRGTLGYYNSLGGLLGMIIPLIFSIFMLEKIFVKKFFYFIIILTCSLALIFTKTRGAWIGCFLGILVISLIKFRDKTLIIIFITILSILIIKPARERIVLSFSDPTFSSRDILWKESFNKMKSYRIITGYGIDGFKIFAEKNFNHFHPHNIFLTTFNDSGIIGILFLILIVVNIFLYFKDKFIISDRFLLSINLGIFGSLIDFFIHGLVDNVLRGETAFLFWFLLGIVFSINRDNNFLNQKR
ncbi:MAG: O-antigen ligase family protein [Endomicrobiia bacterium]